jgi:hypothetical protein
MIKNKWSYKWSYRQERASSYQCPFEEPLYWNGFRTFGFKWDSDDCYRWFGRIRYYLNNSSENGFGRGQWTHSVSENSWSIGQWQFSCFTETTSNLHHPSFINNIDTILRHLQTKILKISPGCFSDLWGMIVSKRIKAFEEIQAKTSLAHWHFKGDTFVY